MFGYAGKVLFINLSEESFYTKPTEEFADFIGGRGINQWLLFDMLNRKANPLGEENIILLGAGVFCGTPVPSASRLSVDFKNVVTGGVGSGNLGGHFAAEMKYAGYDNIVITGKAKKPTYLFITNEGVAFRSADRLWGVSTWETDTTIKEIEQDAHLKTICIGRAGENLVKFACLIGDRGRAAGYGGSGAVFGSKNLKAVAVRGKGSIKAYDSSGFMRKVMEIYQYMERSEVVRIHRKGGTLHAYTRTGEARGHGVRNMSSEFWPNEYIYCVSRDKFDENFMVRRHSCFACPVYCSAIYRVDGALCEGVQANMVRAFATNVDVKDPEIVLRANIKVNDYGLDCDQTSAVIAWAIECYEKGIIDARDTDGLELGWGKGNVVLKLIDMIAEKKGFGAILSNGVYEASKIVGRGSEKLALTVKKNGLMEAAMRSHKAWSLGIITSTKGTGHTRGAPGLESCKIPLVISQSILGIGDISDPTSYDNKPELVFWQEKYKAVIDSVGICSLMSMWQDINLFRPDEIAELYHLLTGISVSADGLMRIGQKVQNVERAFNLLHAGFGRKDDCPPPKLIDIPVDRGIYEGERLELDKWERMLDRYYELHHWSRDSGYPTESILIELGLYFVLKKLQENGIKLKEV